MRTASCEDCRAAIDVAVYGPLPKQCKRCARDRATRLAAARRAAIVTEQQANRQTQCVDCGVQMEWTGRGRPRLRCTPCLSQRTRSEGARRSLEWIRANPERARERDRQGYERRADKIRQAKLDEHLRRKYGIERADYDRMVVEQDGRCAICKRRPDGKAKQSASLHVDHDHVTGKVRGLLCGNCNTMIGLAGERPEVLMQAVEYLREK